MATLTRKHVGLLDLPDNVLTQIFGHFCPFLEKAPPPNPGGLRALFARDVERERFDNWRRQAAMLARVLRITKVRSRFPV